MAVEKPALPQEQMRFSNWRDRWPSWDKVLAAEWNTFKREIAEEGHKGPWKMWWTGSEA